VQRMLDAGLTGKKGGAGFYLYAPDPKTGRVKRQGLNPKWDGMIHSTRGTGIGGDQNIVDQLVLAMVNEAALCIEEDVVEGPRELDLATVFGMGFPPFRGGLLKYADRRGLRDILGALHRIYEAPDLKARENRERFHPAQLIRDLAEREGTFH